MDPIGQPDPCQQDFDEMFQQFYLAYPPICYPPSTQGLPTQNPHTYQNPHGAVANSEHPRMFQSNSHPLLTSETGLTAYSDNHLVQSSDQNAYAQAPLAQAQPMAPPISSPAGNVSSSQGLFNTLVKILVSIACRFYTGCQVPVESELHLLKEQLQRALSILNDLIQPKPDPEADDDNKKYQCLLCKRGKRSDYCGRGTFKRHVTTTHYPQFEYFCPYCSDQRPAVPWTTKRRDKLHEHVRNKHGGQALTPEQVATVLKPLPPPKHCGVEKCPRPVSSWSDFFDCLYQHCLKSRVGKGQAFEWNGDHDGGGSGSGAGGPYFSLSGNGGLGYMPDSHSPSHHGNNGFGSSGARNATGSQWYTHRTSNGMDVPHRHADSRTSSFKSAVPGTRSLTNASTIQEHHSTLSSRNHPGSETAGRDVSAAKDKADSILTKASTAGLGNLLPKIGLDKADEAKTTCRTCGHSADGCTRCEKLDGALIRCHRCADKIGQKISMDCVEDARPRILSSRNVHGRMLNQDRAEDSKQSILFPTESTNLGQTALDALAKFDDNNNRLAEARSMILTFQLQGYFGKYQGDVSKQNAEEEPGSAKAVASANEKTFPRGLQHLRYFERYLYATQSQGSFLSCVHETLIIMEPQRIAISSLQEIVYQRVSLELDEHPEIPSYHLFYLAREKDHGSSESNLQVARQSSPKKRAHLRVRIRAIAGVLALRATVSKSPPAVNDRDAGDGWELGIPLPSLATQEDVVKVLTWLVQLLVVFLKMPPNPKIYVMLASGCRNIPRLT